MSGFTTRMQQGGASNAHGQSMVATPTFSPVAGSYSGTQNVTISCATSGATIHYTTDGSTPTGSSTVYSSTVNVASTETLKALGVKSGMANSAVASAAYTISGGAARFFANTSLWNTVKTPTTYYTQAASVLSSSTYAFNNGAFCHPTYFGTSSDPTTTFSVGAGWGNPSQTITAKAPSGMTPATGSDGVMTIRLGAGGSGTSTGSLPIGTLLDLYGVSGSGTSFTALFYGLCDADNGKGFGQSEITGDFSSGTTAAGCPQAAGTILTRDVQAGVIPHGLFTAWDYSALGGTQTGGPGPQTPPAVGNDDGGGPGPLAEGMLLFIPSGTSKPSFSSAMGGALWDAAATYGVYICDQLGGNPCFYGDGTSTVGNAFSGSDFTTVGQALRCVKTW